MESFISFSEEEDSTSNTFIEQEEEQRKKFSDREIKDALFVIYQISSGEEIEYIYNAELIFTYLLPFVLKQGKEVVKVILEKSGFYSFNVVDYLNKHCFEEFVEEYNMKDHYRVSDMKEINLELIKRNLMNQAINEHNIPCSLSFDLIKRLDLSLRELTILSSYNLMEPYFATLFPDKLTKCDDFPEEFLFNPTVITYLIKERKMKPKDMFEWLDPCFLSSECMQILLEEWLNTRMNIDNSELSDLENIWQKYGPINALYCFHYPKK